MGKTPEGKVKERIKKILKDHGVYYVMPFGSGYGKAGVPDFVCCYKGFFIGIEAKAGAGQPTQLQVNNLASIIDAGGISMIVNESNVDTQIVGWLKILDAKAQ
jgi:Holliday junction resolvase